MEETLEKVLFLEVMKHQIGAGNFVKGWREVALLYFVAPNF